MKKARRNLGELAEKWRRRYPAAIRSWETNWSELSSFFDFPAQIRRLIYTNNAIEGYHRQLRKVTKNKAVFPTPKSVRKLLYLAHRNIQKKWSAPIHNWAPPPPPPEDSQPVGQSLRGEIPALTSTSGFQPASGSTRKP